MKMYYEGRSKKSGIYKIINTANNRIYIGSAKEFKRRATQHLKSLKTGRHHNKFLQYDFNKCGESMFEFHIIETVEQSQEERRNIEEKYILQYFDNCKQCYNMTAKTIKNKFTKNETRICTEETKLKLRKANLGKKLSEETKKRISLSLKGKNRKPLSERQKELLKNYRLGSVPWNKGRKSSDEEKEKQSKCFYSKTLNDSWIEKQRLAHLGKKDSKLTIDRKRLSNKTKKPIIATNIESKEEIYFDSLKMASLVLGIFDASIYCILKGKQKQTKGWTFKRPTAVLPGTIIKIPNLSDVLKTT